MRLRAAVLALVLVAFAFGAFAPVVHAGGAKDPCVGKNPPPECEIPEVPWTLVLPAAAVAVAAVYYIVQRRREGDSSSAA
jgi:hypothetical protein